VLRGSAANNTAADADSIHCHLLVVTGADVHYLVHKPHEHGNQDCIDELKSVQVQVHLPESFVSEHRRFLSGINIPVLRPVQRWPSRCVHAVDGGLYKYQVQVWW
jgi:hypothetical protein